MFSQNFSALRDAVAQALNDFTLASFGENNPDKFVPCSRRTAVIDGFISHNFYSTPPKETVPPESRYAVPCGLVRAHRNIPLSGAW